MRIVSPSVLPKLRRFRKDRRGVTAIEFALVLPPFLLLTLGTLEIALLQLTSSSFANAVNEVSRPIYTGSAGCITDPEVVKELICSHIKIRDQANCLGNTKIVLEEIAAFGGGSQFDDFDAIVESADTGSSGAIMMMQVYHQWEILVPFMDLPLGGGQGAVTFAHNTAFRNEPFGSAGGCP